jgi:hypothetical protein
MSIKEKRIRSSLQFCQKDKNDFAYSVSFLVLIVSVPLCLFISCKKGDNEYFRLSTRPIDVHQRKKPSAFFTM